MLIASNHSSHNKLSMNGENRVLVTNKLVDFEEERTEVQDFRINSQFSIEKPKDHNI